MSRDFLFSLLPLLSVISSSPVIERRLNGMASIKDMVDAVKRYGGYGTVYLNPKCVPLHCFLFSNLLHD